MGEADLLRLRFMPLVEAAVGPLTPPQPSTPNPSELDSLSPTQLAILIRHANDRAETVRQQIGEENWDRLIKVPPAPNESGLHLP